jgi:hypothetical protein
MGPYHLGYKKEENSRLAHTQILEGTCLAQVQFEAETLKGHELRLQTFSSTLTL